MRLGALIKQMKARNLYYPRPEAPFVGFSIALLNTSIRAINTPNWCAMNNSSRDYYDSSCKKHGCSLSNKIDAIISTFDGGMDAPKLEQFLV
jgi:hypothetical protein